MYKYKGDKGQIWLNEKKSYAVKLKPQSNKIVKAVCPECKYEREVIFSNLTKSGHSLCKGCARSINAYSKMIGKRYGRILVLGFAKKKKGETHFDCLCDCGKQLTINANSIKQGKTKSCGCLHKELLVKRGLEHSGQNSYMFGRTGEAHPNFGRTGPLSPTYRFDVTDKERQENKWQRKSPENTRWRKAVFERDNFTCQCCGKRGVALVAHHKNDFSRFPEQRFNVENGITLCKKCHGEVHSFLGGTKQGSTAEGTEKAVLSIRNFKEIFT